MNSFKELRDTLNRPTDPTLVRSRRQGTVEVDYLEWFTVNRILDTHCPGWSGKLPGTRAMRRVRALSQSLAAPEGS